MLITFPDVPCSDFLYVRMEYVGAANTGVQCSVLCCMCQVPVRYLLLKHLPVITVAAALLRLLLLHAADR